jgi:DnaJ family protein C protein 8
LLNLANEGLEARKKEEEVASKKRKAEEEQAWEAMLPPFPILYRF